MIKVMMTKDMNVGMITTTNEGYFKGEVDILEIKRTDHVDPLSATHVLTNCIDMKNVHTNIKTI